jgi:hypothetical protein
MAQGPPSPRHRGNPPQEVMPQPWKEHFSPHSPDSHRTTGGRVLTSNESEKEGTTNAGSVPGLPAWQDPTYCSTAQMPGLRQLEWKSEGGVKTRAAWREPPLGEATPQVLRAVRSGKNDGGRHRRGGSSGIYDGRVDCVGGVCITRSK